METRFSKSNAPKRVIKFGNMVFQILLHQQIFSTLGHFSSGDLLANNYKMIC